MQTVVETPSYLAAADRLFSPDERTAIVERLASDPTCGVVIPGSGGIRKGDSALARAARAAAALAKNEKANLSPAERNALARMVTDMIENYRRRK
jgi:hypothetical protein